MIQKIETGVVKDEKNGGWKAWARKPPRERLLGPHRRFKLRAAFDRRKLAKRLY